MEVKTRMPNAKVLSEKQAIVASLTEKLQGAAAGVLSNIVLFVPTLVVSLATIGSPEAYLAGILFVYLLFLVFILVFNALVTMPLTVGGIRYTMENRCGYPPLDSVLSPFRNKEQYLNVAKATLMYLLDGLYAPTGGHITIGGRDISEIPNATLRANIGFVLQEGYLYTGTVRENIAAASPSDDLQSVRRAASAACVDENVSSFPSGYETVVGERGVTLSGGQKQRVSIARTLLRKTPYLIFDDSLSAVDSETDAEIRSRLAREYGSSTVIMISHRITTVMNADNIIVMDEGRVAEQGTSEQLLALGGIYKRIYDLQMSLPDELKEGANEG